MKTIFFTLFFCSAMCTAAQIFDDFSDGNFTENPAWTGDVSNFTVNSEDWLQSAAAATSRSALFTESEAIDDAEWRCSVKINYNPTRSNYAAIYIIADRARQDTCNGYFVQTGGTDDDVSLYVQKGGTKTKIIDGTDRRTDADFVEMDIKITRDAEGNFALYSRKPDENDFFLEGTKKDLSFTKSKYFGLMFVNSGATGDRYYFDSVNVTGNIPEDIEAPLLEKCEITGQNSLQLVFSEEMNFENAEFEVNNAIGNPAKIIVSDDKKSATLIFSINFERKTLYELYAVNLSDEAGNLPEKTSYVFGILETPGFADVVWNEVMFHAPDGGVEYVEIVNRSDKFIDLSQLYFTTRNSKGELQNPRRIASDLTYFLPDSYVAICKDTDSLLQYFNYPSESKVINAAWSDLNNTEATLVLLNAAMDTIYDEVTYNAAWHHVSIKNPKGVALEKIHPDLPSGNAGSWHSAASEVRYGTPGYKNSQFSEIAKDTENEEFVYTEPKAFSPDNDGFEDLCFLHYNMSESGFTANITIFSATGVQVRQLAANFILQPEGFIIWDGTTDRAAAVNAGIYVILFEAVNPVTGAKKTKKLPITVSYR